MVRIGIIGTNTTAHLCTGVLLTDNHYEISGSYASNNRDSMVFARQYRLVSYSSMEALFKYTDAIVISGYVSDTTLLAEKSLKNFKHTYITHPYLLPMDEIQHLIKLANESGMILQLGIGYRDCAVDKALRNLSQTPALININHQMVQSDDVYTQLQTTLSSDLDLIIGILHINFRKTDVKTWTKTDGFPAILHCHLDCDNGSTLHTTIRMIAEGEPKLEVTFHLPDRIVRTDVFKSTVETQYCELDVIDNQTLEAYQEKAIYKAAFNNFYHAISGKQESIRSIDEQIQAINTAHIIVNQVRKKQIISVC